MQDVESTVPAIDLGQDARVEAVAAGLNHTCVLLAGGGIKCWGKNTRGQLGLGDTLHRGADPAAMGDALPEVDLGDDARARQISCGHDHCCALQTTGQVRCWGANSFGQLGLGDVEDRGDHPDEMGDALPVLDLGDEEVIAVACGGVHSCVLFASGEAKCWGLHEWGRLGFAHDNDSPGDAPGEMGDALHPVESGETTPIASIGAGNRHTCVRFTDGSIKCWGKNSDDICDDDPLSPCGLIRFNAGRLGIGDPYDRFNGEGRPPIDLGASARVLAVSAGFLHTCALLAGGQVKCWGANEDGQLGLGDDRDRGGAEAEMGDALMPVDLGADATVIEVVAGFRESCGLLADGHVKCWGRRYGGTRPDELGAALPVIPLD